MVGKRVRWTSRINWRTQPLWLRILSYPAKYRSFTDKEAVVAVASIAASPSHRFPTRLQFDICGRHPPLLQLIPRSFVPRCRVIETDGFQFLGFFNVLGCALFKIPSFGMISFIFFLPILFWCLLIWEVGFTYVFWYCTIWHASSFFDGAPICSLTFSLF